MMNDYVIIYIKDCVNRPVTKFDPLPKDIELKLQKAENESKRKVIKKYTNCGNKFKEITNIGHVNINMQINILIPLVIKEDYY